MDDFLSYINFASFFVPFSFLSFSSHNVGSKWSKHRPQKDPIIELFKGIRVWGEGKGGHFQPPLNFFSCTLLKNMKELSKNFSNLFCQKIVKNCPPKKPLQANKYPSLNYYLEREKKIKMGIPQGFDLGPWCKCLFYWQNFTKFRPEKIYIDRVSGWMRKSSWMDAKFFLKNPAGLLASRMDRVLG